MRSNNECDSDSVMFLLHLPVSASSELYSLIFAQADLLHRFSHKDTLVIYVHSDTDAEYRNNLQFFIEHAIREEDRCDYVIIVQVRPLASECLAHTCSCTNSRLATPIVVVLAP